MANGMREGRDFEPVSAYDAAFADEPYLQSFNSPIWSEILSSPEGTVVKLHILHYEFVGVAKTHPLDMPGDPIVGRNLALARALKKARKHFRELAYDGVAKHEEVIEQRKEAKHQLAKGRPTTLPEWEEVRKKGWLSNFNEK